MKNISQYLSIHCFHWFKRKEQTLWQLMQHPCGFPIFGCCFILGLILFLFWYHTTRPVIGDHDEPQLNPDLLKLLEFHEIMHATYQTVRSSHAKLILHDSLSLLNEMLANLSKQFTFMWPIQKQKLERIPTYTKELVGHRCGPEFPLAVWLEIHIHTQTCNQGMHLLQSIRKTYPNITVRIATTYGCNPAIISKESSCTTHWYVNRPDKAFMWLRQAQLAKTKYLVVGHHLSHFSEHTNLHRMLQMACTGQADIVGGASRLEPEGHWDLGCYQISLKNFTLRIRPGYEQSTNSCVHCDYISSPILISRELFIRAMQYSSVSGSLAFLDLFVRLIHGGLDRIKFPRAVVCPDVLFHIRHDSDHVLDRVDKNTWTAFIRMWSLSRIRFAPAVDHTWTCREARIHCQSFDKADLFMPPCCLKEQHQCVTGFLALSSVYQITTRAFGDYLTGMYSPFVGATVYQSPLNLIWNRSAYEIIDKTKFRTEFYTKYGCKLFPDKLNKHNQQIILSADKWNWTILGEAMEWEKSIRETRNAKDQPTSIVLNGVWTETHYNPGTMAMEYASSIIESEFWTAELALMPLPFCEHHHLPVNCLSGNYLPLGNIQYQDVENY
ncbi:hypothetical protein FGIG_00778 [Fasciola gigantica]|uniref:Uncharacterized protein n=1 Tax=Fasciola gigantica TaxID=46835 RepID=A0A504YRR2_FASGI|nr:hypothetical protein FGIG_00778 [Fasciola gigantica]